MHALALGRDAIGFCQGRIKAFAFKLDRVGFLSGSERTARRKSDLKKTYGKRGRRSPPARLFLITCPARSGSTMLVHLLRSHPQICSHDEIFSPGKITGLTGTYLRQSKEQPNFIERLSVERNNDPVTFLYKIAFDPQGKQAVGFKLKHDELVLPEYQTLREQIISDRNLRIIHLWRKNLLRRYLSHYIANHVTRVTLAVLDQPVPEVPAVRLDPLECERDFETVLAREAAFEKLFALHQGFSIEYEEMIAGDTRQMAALQDFLGVSHQKLTTTTKKLGKHSLRSSIQNFDELKDFFSSTLYARFFDEG